MLLPIAGPSHGADLHTDRRINVPRQRPWRAIHLPCPDIAGGACPPENLVDMDRTVKAAKAIAQEHLDMEIRVPPIVVSRLYRGGKTTMLIEIAKALRNE
jgi:hypothetical protein